MTGTEPSERGTSRLVDSTSPIPTPMARVADVFATLIRWMNGAGVAWIFALMFLICADIAGRTLFARPIQAVPEIVAFSLVGCVFLQLAYAVQTRRLTHADVLLDYIRQRRPVAGSVLQVAAAGMGCFVLSVIAIGAAPDFWRAFRTGEFTGVEGIYALPIAPIKFVVVLGAVIAAVESLRQFLRRSASPAGPKRSARVLLTAVAMLGLMTLATNRRSRPYSERARPSSHSPTTRNAAG